MRSEDPYFCFPLAFFHFVAILHSTDKVHHMAHLVRDIANHFGRHFDFQLQLRHFDLVELHLADGLNQLRNGHSQRAPRQSCESASLKQEDIDTSFNSTLLSVLFLLFQLFRFCCWIHSYSAKMNEEEDKIFWRTPLEVATPLEVFLIL